MKVFPPPPRRALVRGLSCAGVYLLWFSLLGTPVLADEVSSKIAPATDFGVAHVDGKERGSTEIIKSRLTLVFRDDFNRPDSQDLGPGWTQASHYGVVNEQIAHHHLRFSVPDGHDIPWGSATLDLKNRFILGHGLGVGDYFEVRLRRLSEQGGLGVELFDSDQLRVGGDLPAGASPLQAWNGTTWVPVAFDAHGQPVKFDWNAGHTLGVRFDSADGHHDTFSYYFDGGYAGSWLVATANQTLDKIGVYVQSRTAGAAFEFDGFSVYSRRWIW